ncbi:hypothetical protein GCM10027261_21130 [Geodermatophilus arenarius]
MAPMVTGYSPRPGGRLTSASTAHLTSYGRAAVAWRREGGRLTVDVAVPTGTTAVITLPQEGARPERVGPGRHRFEWALRAPRWREPPSVSLAPRPSSASDTRV